MSGSQENFQHAMNQGHSAAWDQNWEQAALFYAQALQEQPANPTALTSLGLAYFELKKFDEALKCYIQAARSSPTEPLPVEKIARIYERQGKVNEAVQASLQAGELYLKAKDAEKATENIKKALNLLPDHLQGRARLALIFERMGRKQEAIAEYLSVASVMQRSGDVSKAMQVVDHALALIPESPEAKKAKALLQRNQLLPEPQRPKSDTAPVRMAKITPQQETPSQESPKNELSPISEARQRALIQLASVLFDQPDSASPTIRRGTMPAEMGKIAMYIGQAIDAQTQGQDAQAIKDLDKAIDMGLSHPAVFFDLALLLSEREDKKALRYLQMAAQHHDFALASYLLIGEIHMRTNNLKEAVPAFIHALYMADSETVTFDQASSLNHFYESLVAAQAHNGKKEELERMCVAISSQVNRANWREYLKMARQQLPSQPIGSPPLPLSEILLESSSNHVIEIIGHIRKLVDQNRLDAAMEEAHYALGLAPTYLPLHTQIGELLFKKELVQEAMTKFSLIAQLYHLRGETAQAIGLLNGVLQLAPVNTGVREHIIELMTSEKQYDEALAQMMELAQNYEFMADIDKTRQTFTDALRLSQQSKSTRDWSLKILNKIADIDLQRLDWKQALRIFEQIKVLNPNDTNARARLVELNFRLGQDNIALTEIDHYATTMENSGDVNGAIKFVETLTIDWKYKVELRRFLGELYARNNRIPQAVKVFDSIAQEMIKSNQLDETITLLQRIISLNPPNIADYQNALARYKRR